MKKILVIKPSSLGDIIHGLQVVESIRAQVPHSHITWVVESAFESVVNACATVDAVIVFQRRGGLRAFMGLLQSIRAERYDIVLDLQGLARSGLMTCAARAHMKLGRADAREGAGLFYSKQVALPASKHSHAVEILAKFLPALDLREEVLSSLRFDFSDLKKDDLLETSSGAVLVFPESRRAEKEWPEFPHFIQAVAARNPQCRFAWCASERSAELCPVANNIINLAGKTSLRQVIALVQAATMVVANDSGPVHIAAAVGTPVLAVYGPTPPALYGPYPLERKTHRTICAADGQMNSIALEQVMREFDQLMQVPRV
ncbi:glycosyltransferase family 9 protein [Coraliomargarita sp. SDUM461004]|uniref:Glycosyltransferase family 9 protein n=1 Tax=Thalassobacterium sedimentorum TaxID=3041258 RepID=A0ABU1AK03_9BACT|nr:glycosyltransferase family 9 protein [Coraliomargarita sp. SDUM461004]MDQ8195140.1 glycosyltransferase family 9 protein [Coraliomargarita sp. SDUM461004]